MMLIGTALMAGVGLFLLIGSHDAGMAFHGLLFLAAGVLAVMFILRISFGRSDWHGASDDYVDGPIKVATIAAVFWGIAGFIVAWQVRCTTYSDVVRSTLPPNAKITDRSQRCR